MWRSYIPEILTAKQTLLLGTKVRYVNERRNEEIDAADLVILDCTYH